MLASKFMNERYIKWYTPCLSREFEMLVFGDSNYWQDMLPYYVSRL
jgi:hypothetical protein